MIALENKVIVIIFYLKIRITTFKLERTPSVILM